jgi:hypothetical protein
MKMLFAVGFLAVTAIVASFLFVFLLNLAGLPGALISPRTQQQINPRWFAGFIVALIGQSFVALAYVAFVVNWTQLGILHQGLSGWLLWPLAFVAVVVPMWQTYSAAAREAKQDGYFELRHVQLDALGWTTFIAGVAFLVFTLFPFLMRSAYPWVPYMG